MDGNNSIQIANILNKQKIKTPAWYKNKSDRRKYNIDDKTCWTATKIMKIIRDQRYAGDMVGNVRVNTKIAKVSNVRVDREDWIIVENTHEAIISKEVFKEVNECIMPLAERKNVALGENRRSGFCYCPHCGRLLQKNNTTINPYFYCTHGVYDSQCQGTKIMVNDLYQTLAEIIRAYIKMLVDVDSFVLRNKSKTMRSNKSEMSAADIDKEIEKLKQSTTGLYEKYRDGIMDKDDYLVHKKKVSTNIDELVQNKMKILNGIGAKQEQLVWEEEIRNVIQSYKDKETYSEKDFNNLISRVDFEGEAIKIKWRFMDHIEPVLRMMLFSEKQAM
ncbi:Recombinase [Hespellia stercorisuis DSM 15480]|uniref:Recombinase n=2 Tax=Hespellia stercorisuis TaxID=180311 RepID=A0A1M6XFI6_9FIRM|nr:Recombinase [Hespellia stercorisuis DSM 15480]